MTKRNPSLDEMEKILDVVEGRDTTPKRDMPALDEDQVIKALMVDVAKEECFLCAQEPACVNIYHVPESLAQLGQKFVFYTLCECCRLDITSKAKAESSLVTKLMQENGLIAVEVH